MPIINIIDRRKRQYRFLKINAIVEAAWHDNSCKDADRVESNGEGPSYGEREHITLADAITWGQSFDTKVTLFLYDEDGGIYYHEDTSPPVGNEAGEPISPYAEES
jgi:hypothetical protein